jgi:uncharacterized protein YjbI with pentapeptide repeats
MQPLILDKDLKKSAADAEVRGVARGLTLAALSQVKDPDKKRLIVSFLFDTGLNAKPGNLFSLSEANLNEVNFRGADFRGAKLGWADLSRANLSGANLGAAIFKKTVCPDGEKTDTGCPVPTDSQ